MSVVAAELHGARILDLFAGSGALGLEALSRGARHVTFVENAPAALRFLRNNLAALEVPRDAVEIARTDALRFAASLEPGAFEVAFADPPYGRGFASRLAEIHCASAFADVLGIEHGRDEPLSLPDSARQKRYGDTVLTFLVAAHES